MENAGADRVVLLLRDGMGKHMFLFLSFFLFPLISLLTLLRRHSWYKG
jgi:hypothetical protein